MHFRGIFSRWLNCPSLYFLYFSRCISCLRLYFLSPAPYRACLAILGERYEHLQKNWGKPLKENWQIIWEKLRSENIHTGVDGSWPPVDRQVVWVANYYSFNCISPLIVFSIVFYLWNSTLLRCSQLKKLTQDRSHPEVVLKTLWFSLMMDLQGISFDLFDDWFVLDGPADVAWVVDLWEPMIFYLHLQFIIGRQDILFDDGAWTIAMGLHVLTWTTGCRVGTTTPIAQWKKSVRENLEKIVTQRPVATGKSVRENLKLHFNLFVLLPAHIISLLVLIELCKSFTLSLLYSKNWKWDNQLNSQKDNTLIQCFVSKLKCPY